MIKKQTAETASILALFMAIIIGGFVRLIHIIRLDFPLNDGALFTQMVLDLQANQFALPEFTTFNQASIPFAYPPLALYLAGFLSEILKWELLNIVRLLPALVGTLTIPAFYYLSKKIFPESAPAILSTFAFALLPTAFDWIIVGGGLTRSFGYLFSILCLAQVYQLFQTHQKKNLYLSILFASLTVLSHPGTTWFTVYSAFILIVFWLYRNYQGKDEMWGYFVGFAHKTPPPMHRTPEIPNEPVFSRSEKSKTILNSGLIALGTLLITSPWWFSVIQKHGIAVFRYPFQTESLSLASILTPFTFLFTNEPLFDLLAMCAFLGLIISLRERAFLLPAWLFGVFVFESRLGATYSVVPLACLAGIGIQKGIMALATRPGQPSPNKLSKIILGYLLIYAIIAAYLAPNYKTVSSVQIATMGWIKANTPENSQFLVITGTPQYGVDPVSEWFPTLSARHNLTVPQGYEWLPDQKFSQRIEQHAALQDCANQDIVCIDSFALKYGRHFTHIYIVAPGDRLQDSIQVSAQYRLLQAGPGGSVFVRK